MYPFLYTRSNTVCSTLLRNCIQTRIFKCSIFIISTAVSRRSVRKATWRSAVMLSRCKGDDDTRCVLSSVRPGWERCRGNCVMVFFSHEQCRAYRETDIEISRAVEIVFSFFEISQNRKRGV